MTPNEEKLNHLSQRLDALLKSQDSFRREIDQLRFSINELRKANIEAQAAAATAEEKTPEIIEAPQLIFAMQGAAAVPDVQPAFSQAESSYIPGSQDTFAPIKYNLERFIGENLINKIGIIITVIGVAIGAKYSIEHDLVSPLTRIIFGYLTGLGLLAAAIKLKPKYENFSAVLLSGAMANMYFITFAAYSFYGLIPQALAFLLMVIFTAFTVTASVHYNRQIIALFGLVGAYAVPLLLSDGSGRVGILFTYMTIINCGILALSFRKYWKQLFYSAFSLTWLVYIGWFVTSGYNQDKYFTTALTFAGVFFAIFYVTFLAYKLLKSETFGLNDIVVLLINSFLFYGMGYMLLNSHDTGQHYLGFFTLVNAIVHFIACSIVYRARIADRNVFYLVAGLVLVFITMAIPVQLDGNPVTMLWAAEALLLFWIGRTKSARLYEWLSYPVMVIAFFSLVHDWGTAYELQTTYNKGNNIFTPLLNMNFAGSLFFICAFAIINRIHSNKNYTAPFSANNDLKLLYYLIPGLLLLAVFFTGHVEILTYWDYRYNASATNHVVNNSGLFIHDADLREYRKIWQINFTMLFFSALYIINELKIKNRIFGQGILAFSAFALLGFLTEGLYAISELRESYVAKPFSQHYIYGFFNLLIRYISIAFGGLLLYAIYQNAKAAWQAAELRIGAEILMHLSFLWILTSEIIHWMDLAGFAETYKLGLSIFWGIYSLFLIIIGISNKKKHLRIGAMALFGVTLVKLFVYDIAHLNTISKTIVFVSLGVLLLIISFLYNKFKDAIFEDEAA